MGMARLEEIMTLKSYSVGSWYCVFVTLEFMRVI
jgi:hypothetical protein